MNCRSCNRESFVIETSKSARMEVRRRGCECGESWETVEKETPGTRAADTSLTLARLIARRKTISRPPVADQSASERTPVGKSAPNVRASDPDSVSVISKSFPEDPDPERARVSEKFWPAYRWKAAFGRAWAVKYQRLTYGNGSDADSRATGDLADQLATLPPAELLDAQNRAQAMFAEFLGDESPAVTKARHPWSWFVTRFPGLRVPAKPVAVAPSPESFAERDARLRREAKEREAEETRRQQAATAAKAREIVEAGRRAATPEQLAELRGAR